MNAKLCGLKNAVIFLITIGFVALFGSPAFAQQECQLIRINQTGEYAKANLDIFPKEITVPVGSCTVWVNMAHSYDVKVSFRENAQPCKEATKGETGFGMFKLETGQSCYLSQTLHLGQSTSLVWGQPGEFKYTIEATPVPPKPDVKPVEINGMIKVSK